MLRLEEMMKDAGLFQARQQALYVMRFAMNDRYIKF